MGDLMCNGFVFEFGFVSCCISYIVEYIFRYKSNKCFTVVMLLSFMLSKVWKTFSFFQLTFLNNKGILFLC
jgi:hypothetical protein